MLKRLLAVFFLGIPLLISTSCGMVDSYKHFIIEGISGMDSQCLLESNVLSNAWIDEFFIAPNLKETKHGQYTIYLEAISRTQEKTVIIKSVTFLEDGNSVFREVNGVIEMAEEKEDTYRGGLNAGMITTEDLVIESGKEVIMIVDAEVVNSNRECISKELSYKMTIVGYRSFVTVT